MCNFLLFPDLIVIKFIRFNKIKFDKFNKIYQIYVNTNYDTVYFLRTN